MLRRSGSSGSGRGRSGRQATRTGARSSPCSGPKLKRELFGEANVLGQFVRIGGTRFRVIGVMSPKGQFLGFDIDDSAYVPVASAMRMFNLSDLNEIDIVYAHAGRATQVEREVRRLLTERHGGEEDFTVTTQAAMLSVFDNVMNVITMAVGAIAGISLLVGAIGILTMMWIAVGERTAEIGLARAIGATRRQIHVLFLLEAAALATAGASLGVLAGMGMPPCSVWRVPGLPVHTPLCSWCWRVAVSVGTGLLSGLLPARRAAALDPDRGAAGGVKPLRLPFHPLDHAVALEPDLRRPEAPAQARLVPSGGRESRGDRGAAPRPAAGRCRGAPRTRG